ncbi:MAG: sugar-binding domain-containing protein, partial [Aggregatilineales bacterium]
MRAIYPFSHGWLYAADNLADHLDDSSFHPVTLPHTNITLPYHNFDDSEYQFLSTYRKRFELPEALNGRRLMLDFEGAMLAATVSINGHTFEEHHGGYTPFSYDITNYVKEDGKNLLIVHLDSTERHDIPPFGFVVDYLTFGGIYRDVSLRYVEPVHIHNVHVRTQNVLSDNPGLEIDVYVKNQSDAETTINLNVTLSDNLATGTESATIAAQGMTKITLSFPD